MKYIVLFHVIAAAFVMAPTPPAYASFLPSELGNWSLASEHVTELTASEELGKWTSAFYARSEPIARIEVQLTEGAGPGELFVPEDIVASDYETLNISGRRAVLERGDVTGQALAVALETRTVTFESRGISRKELLDFAESMIEALRDER